VSAISPSIIASFAITVLGQILALALLPVTRGFTAFWPTFACVACFIFSLFVSARLVHGGVELSSLTPIATVAIQIFILAISIMIYGESASALRIGLLLSAAVMIGAATRL
jgi:small multidrug resistance pump